jgi:hypothetical protein
MMVMMGLNYLSGFRIYFHLIVCSFIFQSHGFSEEHPNTETIFMDGKLYSWHDTTQPDICAAKEAWQEITAFDNTDKDQCPEDHYVGDFVNEQLNKHCKTNNAKEILYVVFGISHGASLSHYGVV